MRNAPTAQTLLNATRKALAARGIMVVRMSLASGDIVARGLAYNGDKVRIGQRDLVCVDHSRDARGFTFFLRDEK